MFRLAPRGVGVGGPVAAGIGRVDFVNQRQLTINQAELVLGVHQNQPGAAGGGLPAREQRQRRRLHLLPQRRLYQPARQQVAAREAFIVRAAGGFGRGRDQRLRQRVIFAQAVRQRKAVRAALALGIERPQRGGGHAGDVAAHDDFNRQRRGLAGDRHVGVGRGDEMVVHEVGGLGEPPGAELVEHLPLERNRAQHAVEGGHAVGCHQHAQAAAPVHLAHLAGHSRPPGGHLEIAQGGWRGAQQVVTAQHGLPPSAAPQRGLRPPSAGRAAARRPRSRRRAAARGRVLPAAAP